jgi:hypothetical protein
VGKNSLSKLVFMVVNPQDHKNSNFLTFDVWIKNDDEDGLIEVLEIFDNNFLVVYRNLMIRVKVMGSNLK